MRYRIIFCLVAIALLVGTVSADTLIYKIAASADDGYVAEITDSSWQTMRNAAGDSVRTDAGTTYDPIRLLATTTSNEYNENRRGVFLFNTSTIPDDAIIGSSDFAVCGAGGKATALGSPDIVLVGFSYIAGTAISEELYNNFNTNRLATDIPIGSWSTTNWNNWTLNTEGKNYINKTGATPLMLMNSWDYSNSSTGITWSSANKTTILWRDRSTSITTNIPTLTVVYSLPDTTPPASITNLANSTATCEQITWNWTNPTDVDFNGTQYSLTGFAGTTNLTNSSTFLLAGGLTGGTPYTFSTRTFDITGNLNATYVNGTATPTSCAGAPVASFTTSKNFLRIPNPISVTDTSTPTPTSWQWSWGDGTANSTTQNATHTYAKRGKFDIILSVADFNGGSNTSAPVSVKVVGYENYY